MTNSKFAKKKKNIKTTKYSLYDIEFDEWIVNNDEDFDDEILDFTIETEDSVAANVEGRHGVEATTPGNE